MGVSPNTPMADALGELEEVINAMPSRAQRYEAWTTIMRFARDNCYTLREYQCMGCAKHVPGMYDDCPPPHDGTRCDQRDPCEGTAP